MKRFVSTVSAAVLASVSAFSAMPMSTAHADNPMVQTIFSTDPAPMVYGDTVYVYTGSDKPNSSFYFMPDWHCYSSKDMQNWTDHGTILSWDSFSWGKEDSAWAAQCVERNGKFYYYVTLENKSGGGRAIGVAVADSPTGPFKDALGKPLCGPNWDYIDPTVYIDDDGQAWLMFGNPTCYYVQLNEDMISLKGSIKHFDMTQQSFGPGDDERPTSYGEGPWFYKRGSLYYLVYASFYNGEKSESLGYSTAPSPTGPWTYGGQVMKRHNCYTNHPGVVDFKGKSYLFYHDASLKNGGTFDRSVCVDEFEYNSDGSIPVITPTKTGPAQVGYLDPFVRNEAETICWSDGIGTEKCSEGGMDVCNIENGDYIKVKGVDFGDGATSFTASVASATEGGTLELHTGSASGPLIGSCDVPSTDGWQKWQEVSCDTSVEGVQDLYLVFKGGSGYLFNVDWWQFSGSGGEVLEDGYLFHSTFENGSDKWSGRGSASVTTKSGTSYSGSRSLYVDGREAAWNGAIKQLSSSFEAGKAYSFSVDVMGNSGSPETFHLTLQYNDADDKPHYDKIATATALDGKWVQLANTSFKIPENAKDLYVYVETESGRNSFYIDEACAAEAGTVIEGAKGGQLILGDINFDGYVDSFDMALARKAVTKGFKDDNAKLAGDVDRSTDYELNDMVLIQNFILGRVKEFPDNTPEPEPSNFNYDPALAFKAAPDKYVNETCPQAGRIIKENYTGINGNKSMNVYLPYGYDENKKYNVFYLMHGGGENENTIFSNDVKLHNILDHMIMNGELEPLIVVTPTFNGCPAPDNNMGAGTVWNEMRQSVIPYIESKYSTYAENTTESGLKASRYHRAYGGFSMGGGSTWNMFINCLDICAYYMPLSGHCWGGLTGLQNAIDKFGFKQNEYFIFAATGSKDLAYNNMKGLIEPLMKDTKRFTTTSDFSKGNFYFLVADGRDHWWGHVRHYVYDALPYFFHENQN